MGIRLARTTVERDDLKRQLEDFERRYRVPSSRLIEAFQRNGSLHETDDFHAWSSLYQAWCVLTRTR